MKKIYKTIILFTLPILLFYIFFYSLQINFHDWKHGHSFFNTTPKSINWFMYNFEVKIKKISNSYFSSNEKGLDTVDLIIPEKSSRNLLSNIPVSTKKWNRAYLLNKNYSQKVRIRYFGDNPYNYMFEQKNIRVKTLKSEMFGNRRLFEYKTSQNFILEEYLPGKIAKKLGVIVADTRLVELFVNKKSQGIQIEREKLNESFLRRNKIMPINLYKGEDYNNEKKVGLEPDLYNNSGLWSKTAIFKEDDKSDLKYFLKQLKKADNSYDALKEMFFYGNMEIFSKISVLQILNQTAISNHIHNARLLIDPWSGKINLIPHDLSYNTINKKDNAILDWSNNLIFKIFNRSSEYLDNKYELLYNTLKKEKILSKQISELETLKSNFMISQKRDIGKIQRKYYSRDILDNSKKNFESFILSLKNRENNLIAALEKKPQSTWDINKKGFLVRIDGDLPVSDLEIVFDKTIPEWIALDKNRNSILDDHDQIFYADNGKYKLPITLFANRTIISDQEYNIYRNSKIETSNTYFKFIVKNDINPKKIYGSNKYTNKSYELEKKINLAVPANNYNKAIIDISIKKKINIISGDVKVFDDLIIDDETKILSGTTFYLNPGVSVIFRNKISALGNKNNPIKFKKFENQKEPWGTIAIIGKKTANSILKNIIIDGGSGDKVNNIHYTSMLSLHDTENVELESLMLKNNYIYDDMLHVVYSKNINLNNIFLQSSLYDAIDIDTSSKINIKNSKIIDSGNDGIDLMSTDANVYKTIIYNSGDKGISNGEGSRLRIKESLLEKNLFGIVSKDGSTAEIFDTNFKFNDYQLSAYKKNWRYGKFGKIFVNDSNFYGLKNFFLSEGNSEILVNNSIFEGDIIKKGNITIN